MPDHCRSRKALSLSVALLFFATAAQAQMRAEGPFAELPSDNASAEISAIHREIVTSAAALGVPARADAPQAAVALFQYPLQLAPNANGLVDTAISAHKDWNASAGATRDFNCGSRTYDGHNGTDLFLAPYPWQVMDRNEVKVVAALGGTIVQKNDGAADRNCSAAGNPPANYVIISHDNGLLGYYWHLKRGTVTTKAVGARVAVGEQLGFVGSSGMSTGPHLHFEIRNSGNTVIDPYAGQCRSGATNWSHQARHVEPAIMRIATHSIQPPSASGCQNPSPGYATRFVRGATMWVAAALRDQATNAIASIAILQPNGSVAMSFTTGSPAAGTIFPVGSWWGRYTIPSDAPVGEWKVRVSYAGKTDYQAFIVQSAAPLAARITAKVTSPVRSVTPGTAAHFTVTVTNTSANRAIGCRLSLSRPINALVVFQQLSPTTRAPTGVVNGLFGVAPNSATTQVRLTVTPRSPFVATAAEFPLAAKCLNSPTAAFSRANTMLTLTRG